MCIRDRNYKDVYTGGSRSVGYVRNTDREKQYARSVAVSYTHLLLALRARLEEVIGDDEL